MPPFEAADSASLLSLTFSDPAQMNLNAAFKLDAAMSSRARPAALFHRPDEAIGKAPQGNVPIRHTLDADQRRHDPAVPPADRQLDDTLALSEQLPEVVPPPLLIVRDTGKGRDQFRPSVGLVNLQPYPTRA